MLRFPSFTFWVVSCFVFVFDITAIRGTITNTAHWFLPEKVLCLIYFMALDVGEFVNNKTAAMTSGGFWGRV